MRYNAKTINDVRRILADVVERSNHDPTALAKALGKSKDYIRDFIHPNKRTGKYRKNSLSGDARDEIERLLNLERGALSAHFHGHPSTPAPHTGTETDDLIEVAVRVMVDVGQLGWSEPEIRLVAELIPETYAAQQSSGSSPEITRMRLELAIRRALQKIIGHAGRSLPPQAAPSVPGWQSRRPERPQY